MNQLIFIGILILSDVAGRTPNTRCFFTDILWHQSKKLSKRSYLKGFLSKEKIARKTKVSCGDCDMSDKLSGLSPSLSKKLSL